MPYDFLKLVQTAFPPSLVITAYFVVRANMKRDMWYVNNWGRLALEGICITLNGRMADYMTWSREQIATDNPAFEESGAAISTT